MGKVLQHLLNKILEFIFPKLCLGCGESGSYLCADCLAALPQPREETGEDIIAAFDYNDARVKKAIWLLKYRGVRDIAAVLAQAVFDRVSELIAEINAFSPGRIEPWLVLPIPLAPRRRRGRGFNQATELAIKFCALEPQSFVLNERLLVKVRETPSQVTIKDRGKRLINLKGAFAVAQPELVARKNILLIDDVITTGGTVNEARKILKKAGAKRVIAAAAAHG